MIRSDDYCAAVADGCRRSDRARRARARAESAARQLVALGMSDLLGPELREAALERELARLAIRDADLASVEPHSVIVYWRRQPDVLAAVLGR